MLDVAQLQKHLHALDKGDEASQRQAIHALRDVKNPEWASMPASASHSVVSSLQHQLDKGAKPPLVHKEIAAILGHIGPRSKSAVPHLITLLQDGVTDSVREAAAIALGQIGAEAKDAVDRLVVLSKNHNALAVAAIKALAGIGVADHRVKSALGALWLTGLHSQNSQIQLAIALCKLRIDSKGVIAFLTKNLISGPDDATRKAAAEALSWCKTSDLDVVPALLAAMLGDKNDDVKKVAQDSLDLMKLTHEQAIRVCAKQLGESSLAEAALRKSGQLAVPALILALGKDDAAIRVKAARILGGLNELAVDAVPALNTALSSKDSEIRLAAAKSLWNITKVPDDVVPVLVHLLEEKRAGDQDDGEARRSFLQTVIEALWRIGPPAKAAVPVLTHKVKDKNRLVSESARYALNKIAPS